MKSGHGVRFAPSPTGRFHLGNLRTARLSFQIARELHEPWVIRFEDIDRPRVVPGAREQQLEDLAALGMKPDVQVLQSERHRIHFEAWREAVRTGRVYACFCSRAEVQRELGELASARNQLPAVGRVERLFCYSGRCRLGSDSAMLPVGKRELGWRFRSDADPTGRYDFLVAKTFLPAQMGSLTEASNPETVREEDFIPAYPWACGLDDADGNYRLLVRAWDLAEAEYAQREVREWRWSRLKHRVQVFHAALVTRTDGGRLEKRTLGVTLPELTSAKRSLEGLLELLDRSLEAEALPQFRLGESSADFWGEPRRLIDLAEILGPS